MGAMLPVLVIVAAFSRFLAAVMLPLAPDDGLGGRDLAAALGDLRCGAP